MTRLTKTHTEVIPRETQMTHQTVIELQFINIYFVSTVNFSLNLTIF
jgi:hypothetical protein